MDEHDLDCPNLMEVYFCAQKLNVTTSHSAGANIGIVEVDVEINERANINLRNPGSKSAEDLTNNCGPVGNE